MRKTIVLLVLLLSACCLLAQGNMGQSSGAAGTTIEGCLSSTSGHYYLTDNGGKKYFLSGEANKLKAHVGHEIKVTGMMGEKTTDTTQEGAASSAKEMQVFKVKSVQHVADTCTKTGM
jgi:hypothetical protein